MWLWLSPAFAGDLVVSWSFKNIQEGYDHEARMDVFVDGSKVAESPSALQSAGGKMKVSLPRGDHDVRLVAMALYEGTWEEHTIDNEYSIDCEWSGSVNGNKKKTKVGLVFDIDEGTKVQ